MKLIAIMLTTIFTQNFVLSKFLGICPFLGVSKKKDTAIGMSAAVIFVMLLATIVCYPLNVLLEKNGFDYLQTLVFILVIAALVQFVEIVMKKYMKPLYSSLGIFLPHELRRPGSRHPERSGRLQFHRIHLQCAGRRPRFHARHDHVLRYP